MNFFSALVIANSVFNIVVCCLVSYICVLGIKKAKKDSQNKISNKGYRK